MSYTAILGSTRKQVTSTSEALLLKSQGYSIFTDDPFNAVELSSEQLNMILSQEQSQAKDVQNTQTEQQSPLQAQAQSSEQLTKQSQVEAKEQKTFLKKYWLHIIIVIAIIVLLIITAYLVWPIITEGARNIRTVPHI